MTYDELATAVGNQFDEQSVDLMTFIYRIESRLNAEIYSDRDMQESTLVEASTGVYALPIDWRKPKLVMIDGGYAEYVVPELYDEDTASKVYTVIGNTIKAKAGATVTATYYTLIQHIDDVGVNWIMERFPQVYLAGCDYWAAVFLYEDERVGLFKQIFDEAVNRLEILVNNENYSTGHAMAMRNF